MKLPHLTLLKESCSSFSMYILGFPQFKIQVSVLRVDRCHFVYEQVLPSHLLVHANPVY